MIEDNDPEGTGRTKPPEPSTPEISPSEGTPAGLGRAITRPDSGRTVIAEQVVHQLVGVAGRSVAGVYPADRPDAIAVQKGERQAAVDLTVVVDYGVAIVEVTRVLRRAVIEAIEHGTGLEVTEVNITVTDIRLPGGSSAIAIPVPRLA